MFRCAWCENYRDKSECRENPDPSQSDSDNVCEECADEYIADRDENNYVKMSSCWG